MLSSDPELGTLWAQTRFDSPYLNALRRVNGQSSALLSPVLLTATYCYLRRPTPLSVWQSRELLSLSHRVRIVSPFRRSHIFAVMSGMMVVSGDVAINGRASGNSGESRAYPPWTTRSRSRVPVGFLFAQDPKRRFGQVPGQRPDGLGVALAAGDAVAQATDVAAGRA
jgi:hypothetical protein